METALAALELESDTDLEETEVQEILLANKESGQLRREQRVNCGFKPVTGRTSGGKPYRVGGSLNIGELTSRTRCRLHREKGHWASARPKRRRRHSLSTSEETTARQFTMAWWVVDTGCTAKIQELQNEVNCMSDSRDFQDAESIRSGHSHVNSRPVSFPLHPIPGGMLSRSKGMPSRREGPPSIWDTHGISGNAVANPHASSSAPYPQELHLWNSSEEPLYSSTVEKGGRQEQNQDLRCQLGPSAKNSVIFSGGDSSKTYGADQQRLQISDLHFDKFPTPATFACWKIRFKTEVCTCSQFRT